MATAHGPAQPIELGDFCEMCHDFAAVKVTFKIGNIVSFCDLHAFVYSDLIWENAAAIYDAVDILPPNPFK
jgi:hypothetical protein